MGTTVTKYQIQKNEMTGLLKPLIFCCQDESIEESAIPINRAVAEKLLAVKPNRRSFRLPGIVEAVIMSLPDNSTIKNFDVLFNPDYQVDVLQMLITICKKKSFSIIWPGTMTDGRLIYAEPGMADFKQYDIKKYDVTCIV